MNSVTKISAAAALSAIVFTGSQALAASATGSASATIAQPIAVSETTSLNFGTVTTSASAGTAVVSTASGLTTTGGVAAFGGTPSAAAYSVTGEGSSAFTVSLPTTATISSGANTMTVDTFTHNAGAALSGGSATFNVGATLNVGANQPSGAYTGTYTVTVNY
jgi:hypothetical protein